MVDLFTEISFRTGRLVTQTYSTSFSTAVLLLDREIRSGIYSIYGFVRLADEIVDSFHEYNKAHLLRKFEEDYYDAAACGISLNPVLNAFVIAVRKYNIPDDLIRSFLLSMKIDLVKNNHSTRQETDDYIYGSAEVVGLMCLKVFLNGDEEKYLELKQPAARLGAAFQKVNFLRDIKSDTLELNRNYFHNLSGKVFDETTKKEITDEIEADFSSAFEGIGKLPGNSRTGVLLAYYYYRRLLRKISSTPAEKLLETRIRVNNFQKALLFLKAAVVSKLNLL